MLDMKETDRLMTMVDNAKVAGSLQGLLGQVLAKLDQEIDKKVYDRLERVGFGLTEEEARTAWAEKHAYYKLWRSLTGIVTAGQGAGSRVAPVFAATTPSTENGGYHGDEED